MFQIVWPNNYNTNCTQHVSVPINKITHSQFRSITTGCLPNTIHAPTPQKISSPTSWHKQVNSQGITLESLMEILPHSFGLAIHVDFRDSLDYDLHPELPHSKRHFLARNDINKFVDAILRIMYNDAQKRIGTQTKSQLEATNSIYQHEDNQQRSILFISSDPTLCTAINWKQPNCK